MQAQIEDKAIIAQGIGKQYILGGAEQHYDTFRELLRGMLNAPFRKFKTLSGKVDDNLFWALQDIDFEIPEGQITGVIGRNGAGKSTLLKVLSRITAPTTGQVEIRGRVASLLEVGSGFHPELTGRENIFMNASILGMRRAEVHRKLDDIVQFAEVEQFIDTPVKRYSSGMYVRLAFSVAAHVDPDVLLVDEVLAVGDAKFQQRCIGKLSEVGQQGRTVLFVSHNMGLISELCSHVIYLDKGRVQGYGPAKETIDQYMAENTNETGKWEAATGYEHLESVSISTPNKGEVAFVDYDQVANFNVTFSASASPADYIIELLLSDMLGRDILLSFDKDTLSEQPLAAGNIYCSSCTLPARLLRPGQYQAKVIYRRLAHGYSVSQEEISFNFEVSDVGFNIRKRQDGIIIPQLDWKLSKL